MSKYIIMNPKKSLKINKRLVLQKLGPLSEIMSYFGDFFDTFLVLNSMNKNIRERFRSNKIALQKCFPSYKEDCVNSKTSSKKIKTSSLTRGGTKI